MGRPSTIASGMPYQVDVNRLKEAFPVPELKEGLHILHGELEEVVRSTRGQQRYYGVVNSWIKEMANSNGVNIVWEPTQGVEVLDPAGLMIYAEKKIRQKMRQTGKSIKIVGRVDRVRLDQKGQLRYDHVTRILEQVKDTIRNANKGMSIDLAPIKSLPKRIA